MEIFYQIFGAGKDLTVLQMSARALVVFLIALILIRISGRRSFGLRTPLDNIITIVLGAVLSRAIVGASDFLPVIAACSVLVIVHRILARLIVHHKRLSRLITGEKVLIFQNGHFIEKNMDKAQVCLEDIMEEVRRTALTEDLDKIEKIFIERNGEVSAVKK
jgi:uncharacterized membrane protein YcaP (DUF421 family)